MNKKIQTSAIQVESNNNFMRRLNARLKNWNDRRIAIRELQAMPNYLLADIGIDRLQIREAVNGCKTPAVALVGIKTPEKQDELCRAA